MPSAADLAAGLRPGDTVLLPQVSADARTAGVFQYTPVQVGVAGETIRLAVARGRSELIVSDTLRQTDSALTFAAQLAFKIIMLAIAIFVLWRGTDRASMILGIWCVAVQTALPDAWWGLLPLSGRVAAGVLSAALWTSAPFLLYLVVDSVATGVSIRARVVCRTLMVLLMAPELFVNTVDAAAQAIRGCWLVPVPSWFVNAAFVASQLVIVAFFALSYVRTSGLEKQRVRWVFWAFLLSRAGVLLNLFNRLAPHPLHLSGFEWATVLIFPIGCTYAILRHHIIDVNFVLNRTLLYTILTTLVVGIFIVLEDVLGRVAAGRGVGQAVEIIAALLVGLSFNAAHNRIGAWIGRVLFRKKHEAANALRTLADEAPYTENADALLRRTTEEICRYTGAAAVAVYERIEGAYRRVASEGVDAPPTSVPLDDLAFVRLRKSLGYVDLTSVRSVLGTTGALFPFAARGQVSGALLCRGRANGEAYDPDEIALLASVSHEVGAELQAIEARRHSELLDGLLEGSLDLQNVRDRLQTS